MKNTSKNVQKNREISKEVEEILELNEIFYSISKLFLEYRWENFILF